MSHFSLLVVGDDVPAQLDPFYEQVDSDSEYAEFSDQTETIASEYEGTLPRVFVNGKYVYEYEYERMVETGKAKADLQVEHVPVKTIYPTLEDFARQGHGMRPTEIDGEIRYGYYHNPNAKWDWWQIGGRWSGFFWKKDGSTSGAVGERSWTNEKETMSKMQVDSILKQDIDLNAMVNSDMARLSANWDKSQEITDPGQRRFLTGVGSESKEQYISRITAEHPCQTHAVLWDGEWIEEGTMGMFGVMLDPKDPKTWDQMFRDIWDRIPENTRVTVVDCHI